MSDSRYVVDGLKTALGTWQGNSAALVTILATQWYPPEYQDDHMHNKSTKIFVGLVLMHAAFAAFQLL